MPLLPMILLHSEGVPLFVSALPSGKWISPLPYFQGACHYRKPRPHTMTLCRS